ncbi:MAG: protease [Candidatus Diapherotrites archaeon]|uniref:Protease n=1 Tax=Candidatus Iainarchaeum sp. TaxID=3101447 RepID=A0A2D6M184_9ARCH|nr:protease [Candidatus Diapherotrites archaeon]|tara:strand:+ start:1178 stop:2395 length:1218 start_codon:yes stop_codon:yes gene_type:complete
MKKGNKKPELLVGVGSFTCAIAAVKNGANAVYFGVKGFNMRDFGTNFKSVELKKLLKFLHENKVKGYLALNTIVFDKELKKVESILKKAKQANVDAVILSDLAVLGLAKKHKLTPFLSTQASVANASALKEFKKIGFKRVVLARELNLKQIAKIKKEIKGIGIECFVHGAMCISVSGRCFLSHELFGTSANRGKCLQPCRRSFFLDGNKPDYLEKEIFLKGDTIISPKDLKTIEFMGKLIKAGLDSMKIEGRTKPAHYVAVVTKCYRQAIDSVFDKSFSRKKVLAWNKELAKVYNRGFSKGFFFSKPGQKDLTEKEGSSQTQKRKLLGVVKKFYAKAMVAEVKLSLSIAIGDRILIEGKNTFFEQEVDSIQIKHKPLEKVVRGKMIGLKVIDRTRKNDNVFKLVD